MNATVALDGVSKSFGIIEAVKSVTLMLGEGETVAMVGHNGAGKTTLIKLMLGLIRPTEGTVRVLGENPLTGDPAVRARLGYLPENLAFNPSLTGRETLGFYAALKRTPRMQIDPLLERVGISAAADRALRTYSKGMRQRLGLAQALLGDPKVLLLDEPTTGLDPALRYDFYAFLDELRASGATILLCSHALSELEGRADRVVIMGRGAMIANGTLDELRRIAQLPTRIRVKLGDVSLRKPSGTEGWRAIDDRTFETYALPEHKIPLLRSAVSAEIADIDVTPPPLDELYAHFQGHEEHCR
ncbi:ABC transporter ATP-binding protein [Sphingosinicella microcystinivorans]|uniref:ABC transporter ATP-binding protein n=1 Tax=Sphingosinicella microcystinivorans TaxID=335406 RepID=UPI0022F39957|nr:ABC transporter ATP-binding protein [Sphingosinicella microcystinivorans]WBX82842.1 ABC transporter ATP-binding protein [Sphingosinicella microcystinivorans]